MKARENSETIAQEKEPAFAGKVGGAFQQQIDSSSRQQLQQTRIAQLRGEPEEENRTGMPSQLKQGIEALSGMDMSDVRVHRNSDQPAQLNALAYAQGNDIHLGPGQEEHLPHEAWHVVQQRQGRVKPTLQMKEGVPVNDDAGLEREADVMGHRALQLRQADLEQRVGREAGKREDVAAAPSMTVQKMSAATATSFDNSFGSANNWDAFYAAQVIAQNALAGDTETDFEPITFGLEHEWLPYDTSHAYANTAHIVLATAPGLPFVPNVPNKLVTDSDCVVEYSSGVFVFPMRKGQRGFGTRAEYVKMARNKLEEKRTTITSKDFDALLVELNFAAWAKVAIPAFDWSNIDEKTDVAKLSTASGVAAPAMNIKIGKDVSKHKELKTNSQAFGSMQSTLIVPLSMALNIMSQTMSPSIQELKDGPPKSTQTGRGRGSKEERVKAKDTTEPPLVLIRRNLWKYLTKNGNFGEGNIPYIHALCQRLSLLIHYPDAVKFQAIFQQEKYSGQAQTVLGGEQKLKYEKQKAEFKEKQSVGSDNYHSAHSFLKDDLSIWTRIYCEDILAFLFDELEGGAYSGLIGGLAEFNKIELRDNADLQGKMQKLIDTAWNGKYEDHPGVDFLKDDSTSLDLRQDTLRNIIDVDGVPHVQMEIRNLTEKTLNELRDLKL